MNSLFPTANRPGGLASAFAQRAALCGLGGAGRSPTRLDALSARLTDTTRWPLETSAAGPGPRAGGGPGPGRSMVRGSLGHSMGRGWSSAASINLVSLAEGRMANIEVHLDRADIHEVGANYSHFNMFKHLEAGLADEPGPSTLHRQARADALPAPRSLADVASRLSDVADAAYPIYRNMTLHSLLLDARSGRLRGWCCGSAPASGDPPAYDWHLPSFFPVAQRSAAAVEARKA